MFINWSPIRKLIWLKASGAIVPDLPWKTITGNPLSFIARTAHALKSCVVGIEPVQSGSGDPSPDNVRPISGFTGANVTRTGKNLFDETQYQNLVSTYEYSNDSYHCKAIQLTPNTTFTVSQRAGVADSNVVLLMNNVPKVNESGFFDLRSASGSKTFTTDSTGCLYIGVLYSNDTAYNDRLALCQIQIEVGSTASAYEAFSGTSLPLSWTSHGTVYGGTLDVTTGVLTVTHRLFVADGVNIKTSGGYGASGPNWLPAIVLATQDYGAQEVTSDDNLKSNYLKSSTGIESTQNTIAFGNNGKIIVLHIGTMQGTDGTHGYNSANEVHAAVNAYLADHNLQVWYKLETSNTYQLTPQEVSAIVGENNMWTDCATLTVEAKAMD